MKNRLTAKQEGILEQINKTYPRYKLTSTLNLARLSYPKELPYKNNARIYREVTEGILQSFEEIIGIFDFLPLSYRTKIIANKRFHNLFTWNIFPSLKEKEQKTKKPTDKAEKYESYIIYQTMFTIGIEGLIRSMPTGFQNHLVNQIKPLMQLMDSIANFYRSTTGREDIPYPYEMPGTFDIKF